jgi:phosphoribosyl 1,2-cyclic phosphodiesterase
VRVFVLGSGSSGNSLVIESDGARVVIDAGINPTAASEILRALGTELFVLSERGRGASENGGPIGVVVTHEHGDHIAKLPPMLRALRAPAFLHAGILAPRVRARFDVRPYGPGVPVRLGPFEIEAFEVPHDARQMALRIRAGGRMFGLATDLGLVPAGLSQFLGECDTVLVESNHCPSLLEAGPYPFHLKRRVRGGRGHLANEQTAELVRRFSGTRVARVLLGHLSRVNNTPDLALSVVRARAGGIPVDVIPHGSPCTFEVRASRTAITARQLELPFA